MADQIIILIYTNKLKGELLQQLESIGLLRQVNNLTERRTNSTVTLILFYFNKP